jgi:hypothetical protein
MVCESKNTSHDGTSRPLRCGIYYSRVGSTDLEHVNISARFRDVRCDDLSYRGRFLVQKVPLCDGQS